MCLGKLFAVAERLERCDSVARELQGYVRFARVPAIACLHDHRVRGPAYPASRDEGSSRVRR